MKKLLATVSVFLGMAGSSLAFTWNGHDYQLVGTGSGISWSTARSEAQALGSGWDLVSITSEDENNFLKSSLLPATASDRTEYWIGATLSEGSFVWASGEALGYTDWWGGEPNNVNGTEASVAMDWRGSWAWNDEGSAPGQVVGFIAENNQPVPEPASMILLGSGLLGITGLARRKKK